MSVQENEVLVKITSAGTISIPKQFRKFMDVQKGEYVKMILGKDRLIGPFPTCSSPFYPAF